MGSGKTKSLSSMPMLPPGGTTTPNCPKGVHLLSATPHPIGCAIGDKMAHLELQYTSHIVRLIPCPSLNMKTASASDCG